MTTETRKRSGDRHIFNPRVSAIILLLLTVDIAAAQTNSGSRSKKVSDYAELAKAPTKASVRHNPLETDPDAVAAGAKLFGLHCAECHGETANGGKKAPSLRADQVQQATPGALFWLLTNGVVRQGMPVWSKLHEPQRWQLVTYVKSLAPEPSLSPTAGGRLILDRFRSCDFPASRRIQWLLR